MFHPPKENFNIVFFLVFLTQCVTVPATPLHPPVPQELTHTEGKINRPNPRAPSGYGGTGAAAATDQ